MAKLNPQPLDKVRVDKWLWAARFFKTRSLAKQAIDSGKIRCEGQRIKASKDLTVGLSLSIRVGLDERVVEVTSLSDIRRGALEAQALYRETAESLAKRQQKAAEYKAFYQFETPSQRPTKKQRRQIHRFREQDLE